MSYRDMLLLIAVCSDNGFEISPLCTTLEGTP